MPYANKKDQIAYSKKRYAEDRAANIEISQRCYRKRYSTEEGREIFLARKARCRRKLKAETINHYGGCCALCQESDIVVLTIDHTAGNGAAHRKKSNMGTGQKAYHWLRIHKYPKGFRVLCFNCQIKERQRKGCHGGQKSAAPYGKEYYDRFG